MAQNENGGVMSELTAGQVASDLSAHERVCSERYRNIDHSLNELKAMLLAQGSDMHERLNVVSSRIWFGVTSTLGATVIGLAALVFYLLTKGHA